MEGQETGFGENFFEEVMGESGGEDFFSNKEGEETEEAGETLEEEEDNNGDSEEDKGGKKEEDLFSKTSEEEEDDEEEGIDEGKEDLPSNSSRDILNFLSDKGIVEFKEEDLEGKNIKDFLEDKFEGAFDERIDSVFEGLDPLVKQINKFALGGGNIQDFLDNVSIQNNSTELSSEMDLDKEEDLISIARDKLVKEKHDSEYIKAHIDFLKSSNNLKKYAVKHFESWKEETERYREEQLSQTKRNQDAQKIKRRELRDDVHARLEKAGDTLGGFSLSEADKEELPDYMSDTKVKLDNGRQVTPMQRDLIKVLNNPVGSVQIAKLLKVISSDGVLNFQEFKESVRTENIKDLEAGLDGKNKKRGSKGLPKTRRSLADYYDKI